MTILEQNFRSDFTVPTIQFEEQRDQVSIEQIMRVVFLDAERPSPVSQIDLHIPLLAILRIHLWICLEPRDSLAALSFMGMSCRCPSLPTP